MTAAKGKTILVVDDDPALQLFVGTALRIAGYNVEQCLESRQAVDKVRRTAPDLVILDVMMERGTSGFDIAQQLRRDPATARLPILMLSAIHKTTRLRFSPDTDGEYLPVDEFVNKPVTADELLAKVEKLLADRRE